MPVNVKKQSVGTGLAATGSFLSRHRFLLLSLLLFLSLLSAANNGFWIGDFWEHGAVVRELTARPLAPRHPLLALDLPHAFFSPYALGVALPARVLGLSPITALALAGLVNLTLFLGGLLALCRALFPGRGGKTAFYTLLFSLFFWGKGEVGWSGFFNLDSLGYNLPYPATFAAGITLLTLAGFKKMRERGRLAPLLLLLPACTLVLLTHPTTALALFAGLAALLWSAARRPGLKEFLGLGLGLGMTLVLTLAWPYFSFWDLLFSQATAFHQDCRSMYENLARFLPALLALPLLAWRWHAHRRDPLVFFFLLCLALYLYGYLTGKYGYGRICAWLMLLAHLGLGGWAATQEEEIGKHPYRSGLALTGLALLTLYLAPPGLTAASRFLPGRPTSWGDLAFLETKVGAEDTVLAPLDLGWHVPTFAGRIIASPHPLYWLPDHAARQGAVTKFFNPGTGQAARRRIINKYGVQFILVPHHQLTPPAAAALLRLGELAHTNQTLCLIRIKATTAGKK